MCLRLALSSEFVFAGLKPSVGKENVSSFPQSRRIPYGQCVPFLTKAYEAPEQCLKEPIRRWDHLWLENPLILAQV